jgi:hypothetical protein
MKRYRVVPALILGVVLASGCSRQPSGLEIQTGTEVSVEKTDGVTVAGRLVEVQPQEVVLEAADGQRTRVARSDIRALRTVTSGPSATASAPPRAPDAPPPAPPAAPEPEAPPVERGSDASPSTTPPVASEAAESTSRTAAAVKKAAADAPRLPEYREVQVPAGTVLAINLKTTVGSAKSQVEDAVRGTVRSSVNIDGLEAIPAGATVVGSVTAAERSARVKGRARIAFRFAALELPGDAERISIRTAAISREAEGTKKEDAAKIGGGAAAGALIGGIIGGGDGAAKGAAIGGGAGTGVVLSTRGKEVTLPAGANVSTKLLEPVTIRVRVK